MKKVFLTVLMGTCFLLTLQPANSMVASSYPAAQTTLAKPDPINERLIQEFLTLTPRKYYKMTGKRMKLSEKIALKLTQRKIKRMIKRGEYVDLIAMSKDMREIDTSDFNIAGFVLGLILSLIGVLIAYLIDDSDSSMIKWAWIGAGVQAVLILLALII